MILSGQIKLTSDFIISFNKTPAYHKIKKNKSLFSCPCHIKNVANHSAKSNTVIFSVGWVDVNNCF